MTKKDYILLAAVIADRPLTVRNSIGPALADALAAQNPRFDRSRFLTACGVSA